MNVTSPKLEYRVCGNETAGMPVIIVAAGQSSRMNGIDKLSVCIAGIPVIARTLLAFERSKCISRIIVVTCAERINEMQLICEKYMISKLSDITAGGETRQASVVCGLSKLSAQEKYVLIHDGARPLVPDSVISAVADELPLHDGVTCGVPLKDTVKRLNPDGSVAETLDRSSLFAVQTPQGVNVAAYRSALEKAAELSAFTDDMSVLEAAGCTVFTVAGDYRNIKITTPDDIALTEKYLTE